MNNYDIIIGLEIHVELATKTKAFCSCRNEFGAIQNLHVCPVCLGLPGALPSLNKKAVEMTILGGLVLGARINRHTLFERKNYFYPDLSKGYQITQFKNPICTGGGIMLSSGKFIRINRIHLEEDTGKLIHNDETSESFVDFNRSGVPLLEIVSEPDIRSVEEAQEFMDRLKDKLVFAGLSQCRMERGELRFDVNISVSRKDSITLGTRVELKNLNSFKSVANAIDYESKRHIAIIENDGKVLQETRGWDDISGKTYSMRLKETESDYRYFPDPDVLEISITDKDIQKIKDQIPETIESRIKRYSEMGLNDYDIDILTNDLEISDYFDAVVRLTDDPQETANWIKTEVLRVFNESSKGDLDCHVPVESLASIILLLLGGNISRFNARVLFEGVVNTGKSIEALIKELDLEGDVAEKEILCIIENIVANKPSIVDDYRKSPEEVAHYFVGQIMKQTNGKADIDVVLPLIDRILDK